MNLLFPAVHGNDPCYPNPTIDEELWDLFADTYIKTSRFILDRKLTASYPQRVRNNILGLPRKFIDLLKTKFLEQAEFEANADIFIQFGEDSDDGEGDDEDEIENDDEESEEGGDDDSDEDGDGIGME